MMKIGQPSRLRVLLIALIFSAVMVLGQTKRADANNGAGYGGIGLLVVAAVVTYATIMGVVCTPIAAANGEDYPGGFSAAFGDCFTLERSMQQTAPAGDNNDASDTPAGEEDEGWYRDND